MKGYEASFKSEITDDKGNFNQSKGLPAGNRWPEALFNCIGEFLRLNLIPEQYKHPFRLPHPQGWFRRFQNLNCKIYELHYKNCYTAYCKENFLERSRNFNKLHSFGDLSIPTKRKDENL